MSGRLDGEFAVHKKDVSVIVQATLCSPRVASRRVGISTRARVVRASACADNTFGRVLALERERRASTLVSCDTLRGE